MKNEIKIALPICVVSKLKKRIFLNKHCQKVYCMFYQYSHTNMHLTFYCTLFRADSLSHIGMEAEEFTTNNLIRFNEIWDNVYNKSAKILIRQTCSRVQMVRR